ncbi:MAG TPA: c-type cytochrome [Caldimonas sp.]
MTDAPESQEHDDSHEGPIRTPKQLILAVLWAHILPIGGILLLVAFVTTHNRPSAGSDALAAPAVAKRIQPVGHVELRDTSDVASLKTGEQVFAAQCTACHTAGVAGAPKFGDAAAWAPRIATGYDALLHSALAGKGAMTPQGGGDFSDLEVGRAVVYMADKAGAKFEEPKAPPATPASAKVDQGGDAAAAAGPSAQAAMATATTSAKTAPAAPEAAHGAAVPALYTQICQACHAAGVAGAPKLGDKAAWAPRLAQGIDGLTASAIKGKGAMPPKGGSAANDADIKAVVTYMANTAK